MSKWYEHNKLWLLADGFAFICLFLASLIFFTLLLGVDNGTK